MTTPINRSLVAQFRRAGSPALLAACLAAGPAFAQTTVTTTTPVESSTTKTTVKEKRNGDVVIKENQHDGDAKVKSKTVIDEDGDTKTKTTIR